MPNDKKHPAHQKKRDTGQHDEPIFVIKKIDAEGEMPEKALIEKGNTLNHLGAETERRIETQLAQIYTNDDGSMPDMKRFERRRGRQWLKAVITLSLSLAFLFAVVFAGMTIFQPTGSFAEEDVVLSVSGEEKVAAGEPVTYRIRYKNAQRIPLAQVTLYVRYPKGFVFDTSTVPATNDTHTEWAFGAMKEEDGGFLDITGRLYGDIGGEQSFRVFFNYTPSNFSSEFQKVATHTIMMAEPPISMILESLDTLTPGADAQFVIRLKQIASTTPVFAGARLVFDGGSGFVKREAKPQSDPNKPLEWTLGEGLSKDDISFVINGSFGDGDAIEQKVSAALVGEIPGRAESSYTIMRVEKTLTLLDTDISLRLSANGNESHSTVAPGGTVHAIMTLQNTASTPLTNVRIRLLLDAPSYQNQSILLWNNIQNPDNALIAGEQIDEQTRRGILTWSRAEKSALSKVDPGQSITVEADIPIKSSAQADLSDFTTALIHAVAEVQYTRDNKQEHLMANTIDLAINSDTALDVTDEKSINGSGKETHLITWAIKNTFHELKNITVTADMFGDIIWDPAGPVAPAGSVSFDTDKRRITWQINTMPTELDVLALQFPITLNKKNPTQTQLTSKPMLTATDAVTGKEILAAGDEVGL